MRSQIFTVGGIVADAVICGHPEGDTDHYFVRLENETKEELFHRHDVLPFGLRAASDVFAKVGQHCNKGIIVGTTNDTRVLVRTSEGINAPFALGELALLPALANESPPHRIGSRVKCRRHGRSGLSLGTIVAAKYDCTYEVEYEDSSKVSIDTRMLHNDIVAFDTSIAESPTVRDRVTISMDGHHAGRVIEVLRGGRYRVVLDGRPKHAILVDQSRFVDVASPVRGLLRANPQIRKVFNSLRNANGQVVWKEAKEYFRTRESFSVDVSPQQVHAALVQMCLWSNRPVKNMLTRSMIQDDDMLLGFEDFEYVFLHLTNIV